MKQYICVQQVGRNPEHPTWRIPGLPTEQRLEIRQGGNCCSCLTSVQKDNLILEVTDELP